MSIRCAVFGCSETSTTKVKVPHPQTGEELYPDVCRPHFDQIQRDRSAVIWDPLLAAVRLS